MNHVYYVYPGGRFRAETFSYDDNTPKENRRLIEMFNDYQVKATFNLNSGFFFEDSFDELRRMYAGHEVACHTSTHPSIDRAPLNEIIMEISEDKRKLERIFGYPVRGMAYPNRACTDEIIRAMQSCGIRYGRVGDVTHDFGIPQDYYHWKGSCHHTEGLMETGREFMNRVKPWYLFLCYVWGHGFEFERDGNWGMMEEFLKLTAQKEDTWYTTNIGFVDYMDACHALQFGWDNQFVYNPTATECWLLINGKETFVVHPGELLKLS